MMPPSWPFMRGLVLLLSSLSLVFATWEDNFAGFFPEYNDGFQLLLRNNCYSQHAIYLEDRDGDTRVEPILKAFGLDSAANNVIQCLLASAPEAIKVKMASAQVVLGLTPSILATLGASPQETAMLSVFAKRPLLAGLLAAGSPAVFPLRSFEYTRTIEDLLERDFQKPAIFTALDPVILALEYLLAAASVGNISELCYQLGGRVLSAIFTGDEQHFYIWAFLGMAIHGFGALALHLRTKVTTLGGEYEDDRIYRHHGHTVFNQFKPMARQTRLCIEIRRESLLFLAIYWFTTLITVCHIIYGTILFSSMLFISVEDAISVIARLMGSVIVCRIVLSYELVNLQNIVKEIKKERMADNTDATAEREMAERQVSKQTLTQIDTNSGSM